VKGYDSLTDFRSGVREIFVRTLRPHVLTEADAAELAPGRYVAILGIGHCKLRVFLNLGDVEIAVGRESAPVTAAHIVGNKRVWYPIQPMIARVVDPEQVDWDGVFFMDARDKLRLFAEWLALSMKGWETLDGWCLEAISQAEGILSAPDAYPAH
jgi:hypothetical protein